MLNKPLPKLHLHAEIRWWESKEAYLHSYRRLVVQHADVPSNVDVLMRVRTTLSLMAWMRKSRSVPILEHLLGTMPLLCHRSSILRLDDILNNLVFKIRGFGAQAVLRCEVGR